MLGAPVCLTAITSHDPHMDVSSTDYAGTMAQILATLLIAVVLEARYLESNLKFSPAQSVITIATGLAALLLAMSYIGRPMQGGSLSLLIALTFLTGGSLAGMFLIPYAVSLVLWRSAKGRAPWSTSVKVLAATGAILGLAYLVTVTLWQPSNTAKAITIVTLLVGAITCVISSGARHFSGPDSTGESGAADADQAL